MDKATLELLKECKDALTLSARTLSPIDGTVILRVCDAALKVAAILDEEYAEGYAASCMVELQRPIVVIAGSRWITDPRLVAEAIEQSGFEIGTVLSGGCRGVDKLAEQWAEHHNRPLCVFRADWKKHGKSAGPKRNFQMAAVCNALIAIWDGRSRGAADMIRRARDNGRKVYIHRVPPK